MNSDSPSKGSILIVDDSPDNLRALSVTLAEDGYKSRCVTTGEMAYFSYPPISLIFEIEDMGSKIAVSGREYLLQRGSPSRIGHPSEQDFERHSTRFGTLLTYTTSPTVQLTVAAEYSALDAPTQTHEILLTENPYVLQVLAQDQAIVSANVYANPLLQPMEQLCQQIWLKSTLAVRTSYQGQSNGMLALHQCDRFHQWTMSEVQLIEAIAAQVGIVLAQINAMCNLKPKTQNCSRVDGHPVPIHPRTILGFMGSFLSCTSRQIRLLEQEKWQREVMEQQNLLFQQEIHERQSPFEICNRPRND